MCELQNIDRETKKLFTIYGGLHPTSDIDRFYMPRKEGGKGLISIVDCVKLPIRELDVYIYSSLGKLQDRWIRNN